MIIARPFATAMVALTLVGCTEPVPPVARVPTVTQAIDRSLVLQLDEELRLDGSRDDLAFFRVTYAVMDDNGHIYVLDAGNTQVVVFDATGQRVRTIGRQGQGPGEFGRPGAMWLRGDTLGVSDSGNRLHLFRASGSLISTRAYLDVSDDDDFWSVGSVVGTSDGWFVTAYAGFRRDSSGSESTLPPLQRQSLFRVAANGDLEPGGFYFQREIPGEWVGAYFVEPPFAFSPIAAMDGLGRLHLVRSGDYVIDVYDSSGALLHQVVNRIERDRVTRADLAQWRDDRACKSGSTECDEGRTELALTMEIPEYKPVVGRLVAFPTGHIAVLRQGTDPDPEDRLAMGEYDLFDPAGGFMGRLPIGLSPRWFDGQTLLATEWNEVLVPSLVRYRVREP